ncbi:TPA: glycosyltransferase [Vibrio parahaemolyticus]|nr:glycosyltransferase [Vibrio parahaemolyticus]
MKIIFLMENFERGGVERVTYQLIYGLKNLDKKIELLVCCESEDGDLKAEFHALAKCCELQGDSLIKRSKSINEIILDFQPDLIVYTKGGLSKYNLFINRRKIKTVAIQHVPIDLPDTSLPRNILRIAGGCFLYRMVDKVVCVSQGIESNLIKLLGLSTNRTSVIYNPVLDESILLKAKENVKYENYFVCVGRIHYQKGYDILIKIIQKVIEVEPSVKVVVLGGGEDIYEFRKEVALLELDKNIIFHGSTSNPYKYIVNAKALLLPSRWEGLPTVLVESAYLKTQIIAFDCRYGPRELTNNGKNGYLIPVNDINKFADGIIQVNNGNIRVDADITSFKLETSVLNYLDLFEKLLCKKS